MSEQSAENDLTLWERIDLRWFAFRCSLRRCPECRQRGFSPDSPPWRNDKTAKLLGINMYGCPRCGKGAVAERDQASAWPCDNYTEPHTCLTLGIDARCGQCRDRAFRPGQADPS